MWHDTCQSVNHFRGNNSCELLASSVQRNRTGNAVLVSDRGWNHFETDFNIITLGPWCTANNPCQPNERCKDVCFGTHKCVSFTTESLRDYIETASQSSDHNTGEFPAIKAFDGNNDVYSHTARSPTPHWIKATFKQRVFINYVIFVNRLPIISSPYDQRNDNMRLETILHDGGQSRVTVFGNTGILGTQKNISCMQYADEFQAFQPLEFSTDYNNIGEIWIYGRVVFTF
ncbi:uncharacterized protein [Clytia hemisphaerica]